MTSFKDVLPIIAVGAAAYFFLNRDKRAPSDNSFQGAAAPSLSSPVAQDAFANITQAYGQLFAIGVQQAIQTSRTAAEAMQSIAKLPTTNPTSNSLRGSSSSSNSTQRLVQQTSLKPGGGATGLKDGTYKISGLGTVTVKSGPAKKNAANLRTYTGR